jgi:hypothetical protein
LPLIEVESLKMVEAAGVEADWVTTQLLIQTEREIGHPA